MPAGASCRRQLERHDADDDQTDAGKPQQIDRFTEEHDAEQHRASGADAGPHRVSRADRQHFEDDMSVIVRL